MTSNATTAWDGLDWSSLVYEPGQLPEDFLIPERHYAPVEHLGLSHHQRLGLNRLFTCFTCELFIHFEHYVITYLERHSARVAFLPREHVSRFVHEERLHVRAFERLLRQVHPELYGQHAQMQSEQELQRQFLRWDSGDARAVNLAPPLTFFLLAWLFEEVTLFVPEAWSRNGDCRRSLVRQIMVLHAREERGHVDIDRRVLATLGKGRFAPVVLAQTLLTLPLLLYVDHKVAKAWPNLIARAVAEVGLDPSAARELQGRAPTLSDRLGIASFARQLALSEIAGGGLLSWILSKSVPAVPVADLGTTT